MAFNVEKLSEEQSSEISEYLSKYQKVLSKPLRKTFDHDRNLFFFDLGGRGSEPKERGEAPNFYVFIYQEKIITFEAYDALNSSKDNVQAFIEITHINIPYFLQKDIDIILQAIREAISTYWKSLFGEGISTHTSFPEITYN